MNGVKRRPGRGTRVVSIRIDPVVDARFSAIAERCGLTRAELGRRLVTDGVNSMPMDAELAKEALRRGQENSGSETSK